MTTDLFEESKCAAVKIVAHDDMRTTFEHFQRSGHGSQPRCERKAACSAFQIGNTFFVSKPGRVDRACVVVTFMFAWALLHVGRGRVDRSHDRARAWVGFLSGVNGAGRE